LRENGSSGEDVSVIAVIIPKNWLAIPSEGRSPEEGYCSPILRNDDRIHRYVHMTQGKKWGSLIIIVKLKFTIKDPPEKAIHITYCNSLILLINISGNT
jgi:hypothetical protein